MITMALLLAGWGLLAASQPRQFNRLVHHGRLSSRARTAMRSLGAILLLAPLMILMRAEGPSFGPLVWACLLSISAMAVALMLAWLPGAKSAT
ncbi:DUF3325 family protein [Bradyrhizobium sp. BR 10289]|uniref:DUF3325 family protein n=1 Tax=Bradyrhizobium sp. BR 10289 TaxID=2749993 RepID=UPI001C64ECED|nr:DUF3325 family protein [Bradyrhizobium sp. BR 10289]MBW7974989.1 DUF3325 family protein [Bradyrhizobium sp. BR 10289]